MTLAQIGVVGMAVMGKNLALNLESRGYHVAIFNRSYAKTQAVKDEFPKKNLIASQEFSAFVQSIERPRRIILMVKAGSATDATIESILPLLDSGDILIDGGNSYYQDTRRRSQAINATGIHFMGMGVSGGEEGALHGPALMPGGPKEAYDQVAEILQQIAAKDPQDHEACVAYMGPDGAGHYVKMVHNGIEYADMQLIAEIYEFMRYRMNLPVEEIASIFDQWNQGELQSYLIEITANILSKKDPKTGEAMIDMILDRAGNKGTGKWTSQSALDLGLPSFTITASVFSRYISAFKEQRVKASQYLSGPDEDLSFDVDKEALIEQLRQALYLGKLIAYAQGFSQYQTASVEYNWQLDCGQIAQVFRGGCIIQARFLQEITQAYRRDPELENLLLDPYFAKVCQDYQKSLRQVIVLATQTGIAIPALMSSLSYYDAYRSDRLPANLIQAQRDYFGAHTYERVDRPGAFHYHWLTQGEEEV